jgi:hypothetical protein
LLFQRQLEHSSFSGLFQHFPAHFFAFQHIPAHFGTQPADATNPKPKKQPKTSSFLQHFSIVVLQQQEKNEVSIFSSLLLRLPSQHPKHKAYFEGELRTISFYKMNISIIRCLLVA